VIVLDTTMLHYAVVEEHELREDARRLVAAVEAGRIQATTTVEVVQEFAHIYAKRRSRAQAVRIARQYSEMLAPLLSTDRGHLDAGLRLYERHAGLGAFDAVLAAVAMAQDAPLISADSDFKAVAGLRHVAPGTPAFEELLAQG